MAYNLIFTDAFEKDLDSILDYIINRLYNPTAAARLYKNVKTTFTKITELLRDVPSAPAERKGLSFLSGRELSFVLYDRS